jgi:DNA mismatch endonuclease, patch repair protein
MADVFTQAKRSLVMAAIRSKGNLSTEMRLISLMGRFGVTGWRRGSQLPGRPDFVFSHECVAVFVDGCFWHGCPRCSRGVRSNSAFWLAKIAGNVRRDARVSRRLRRMGWSVVRVREHEIRRSNASPPSRLLRVLGRLR